ncbi:MAG: glycerol-3-phosphate dehydrogenase/oxidase [bacterium]
MHRQQALARIRDGAETWDVLVVGGGATGVGAAVDAASRGYRTLLLEARDFGKGASSRSTKLIHGGVRYLRQGNLSLVRSALEERAVLLRLAPHLVREITFVVPSYGIREGLVHSIGLALYDALAGRRALGRSRSVPAREVLGLVPTIDARGLRGGTLFRDARFEDARLLVHLARTAAREGAVLVNHAPVVALERRGDVLHAALEDRETGERLTTSARAVINAAGPFVDDVRRLDDPAAPRLTRASRGTHVVLPRTFLPGETALLLPDAGEGRVVFLVPWRDRVLLGTTDVAVDAPSEDPSPSAAEVEGLLALAGDVLAKRPAAEDVRSVFAGLRPLPARPGRTSAIARDHVVRVASSGLVTVAGGKWTTYRRMAKDAVDRAAEVGGLPPRACRTDTLLLHGAEGGASPSWHGSDAAAFAALCRERPELAAPVHPGLAVLGGDVVWAARFEMARTVEDVLARRTQALLLDAKAAAEASPEVAKLLARELGRDAAWERRETESFERLSAAFRPEGLR